MIITTSGSTQTIRNAWYRATTEVLVFLTTEAKHGPRFITSSQRSFTEWTLTMNFLIVFMPRNRTTRASVFQVPVPMVQLRYRKALFPEQVKVDSLRLNPMIRTLFTSARSAVLPVEKAHFSTTITKQNNCVSSISGPKKNTAGLLKI